VSLFKEKRGIWEMTITSTYPDIVDSEVQLSTPTTTNADKFFPNYQPIGKRRVEGGGTMFPVGRKFCQKIQMWPTKKFSSRRRQKYYINLPKVTEKWQKKISNNNFTF
jgi:hypothetical protein